MSAIKKITFFGILTEIIYLAFILIEPLRKTLGDTSLTLSLHNLFFIITALLVLACFFYVGASNVNIGKKEIRVVIIFFIIFNATLFFAWPLTSVDIFTYIHTSRVLSIHHANPYIASFNDFPNDAFSQVIKNCWSSYPTPYGPIFTIISSLITFIGKKSLLLSLYLLKLLFVCANILSVYLIQKVFKNYQLTFLYAWNPLILFEFCCNGHNDILTILLLLTSFYFLLRSPEKLTNYYLAFVFLFFSVLIKYITAIFVPIFILLVIKKIKTRKEKIKFTILTMLISLFLIFIFYAPFWNSWNTFSRIILQTNHIYPAWIFASFLVVATSILLELIRIENYLHLAAIGGKIIFIFFYLILLLKIVLKRNVDFKNDLIVFFLFSLLFFYLTFFTWFMPWYLPLLIFILIIYPFPKNNFFQLGIIYLATLYGILYYIILR